MAVSFAELLNTPLASTSNTDTYTTTTLNTAPSSNSLAIVAAVASGTVAAAPTCSGAGLTWALHQRITYNTTDSIAIFRAMGTGGTTGAITVVWVGDAATGCALTVIEFTGVYTGGGSAGAIQETPSGTGTASKPALTYADLQSANAFYGVTGVPRNPAAWTPPTTPDTWTEHEDTGYGTPTTGFEDAYVLAPTTAGTHTWSAGTNGTWGALGIEIIDASNAPAAGTEDPFPFVGGGYYPTEG